MEKSLFYEEKSLVGLTPILSSLCMYWLKLRLQMNGEPRINLNNFQQQKVLRLVNYIFYEEKVDYEFQSVLKY
jgi:hypothetical protein